MALDEYTRDELNRLDETVARLMRRNKSLSSLVTSQRKKIRQYEREIARFLDIPGINYELELENRMLRKRLDHAIRELATPKPKRNYMSKEEWLFLLRQL